MVIAEGAVPTATVVITELVAGSIGFTVPSSSSVTQTACRPTVTADGPRPTGIVVMAPVVSSMRTTRFASR
jgi:phage-related minor tail protein